MSALYFPFYMHIKQSYMSLLLRLHPLFAQRPQNKGSPVTRTGLPIGFEPTPFIMIPFLSPVDSGIFEVETLSNKAVQRSISRFDRLGAGVDGLL